MMHEAEESPLAHRRLPRLIQGSDTSHHSPSPRHTERTDGIVASTSTANGTAVLQRRCHSGDREEDDGRLSPSSASSAGDAHTGKLKPFDKEILLKPEVEVSHKSKVSKLGSELSTVSDTATDALTEITGDLESGAGNGDSDGNDRASRTQQLRAWIHRVRQTFGTGFLLLVCAVYASQGFNSFSALAVNYFFKDHLKLQPAESQALMTVMMSPWGIKPVYGIISDSLPFFKYHRKSYMILFSTLGAMGFLLLSFPDLIDTPFEAVCVLTVNSLAASVIDVVIDARVVEMSRLDPKNGANDLQSVSWTAMAIGGVIGSVLSGPATDYLGVRGVFFFASIGPFVVLAFSLTMHEPKSRVSAKRFVSSAKRQFLQLKGAVLTPVIWKCALWVFLSGAVSPGYSQVFFYFSTDVLKFTPEFLGTVSAFGFAFLLLGTLIYNAFFKDVSFRRIFLIAQLSLAVVSLLDVILVTRTNLRVGIPDKAFVLGDAVIADVVSRLKTMPVLVLCAKLCPKGIEGTLFALLMSISNFSFSVSEFWGAFICHSLGIQKDAYEDLWIAIVLRSLLKLTPILFLFLIPTSDPQEIVDRINYQDEEEEEEEEDGVSPHGVIRADHMVNGSPDATPAPRNAPQKLEVAV